MQAISFEVKAEMHSELQALENGFKEKLSAFDLL